MALTSRRKFLTHTLAAAGTGVGTLAGGAISKALAGQAAESAPDFPALDIHVHLPLQKFGGPLASRFGRTPRAGASADALALNEAVRAETLAPLADFHLEEMQTWGVEASAVMQIDFGLGDDDETQWAEAEALSRVAAAHPGRLHYFFGCDPRRPDAVDRLERAARDLDARGVKVHALAGFAFDDPDVCFPYYAKCEERGLPVLGHCRKLGLPPRDRLYTPERFGNVAAAFPDLKVCMGHMGGPSWREEALAQLERHDNLYGDLSFYQELFAEDPEAFFAFLRRILDGPGRRRIMYGTDWPNGRERTAEWLAAIRAGGTEAHPLTAEEIELVLRRNAETFLDGTPV